jgi:hypothetical protein
MLGFAPGFSRHAAPVYARILSTIDNAAVVSPLVSWSFLRFAMGQEGKRIRVCGVALQSTLGFQFVLQVERDQLFAWH